MATCVTCERFDRLEAAAASASAPPATAEPPTAPAPPVEPTPIVVPIAARPAPAAPAADVRSPVTALRPARTLASTPLPTREPAADRDDPEPSPTGPAPERTRARLARRRPAPVVEPVAPPSSTPPAITPTLAVATEPNAPVVDEAPPRPVAETPAVADPAPLTPPAVHHPAPAPAALGQEIDEGIDERRARSVTSIIGRLRTPDDGVEAALPDRPEWPFDRVGSIPPVPPTLDPEMTLPLDRGDVGEGRVGQTIEGARVHGLEALHGLRIAATVEPIDHLVVAVNGIWVIRAVPVLAGKLERRDVGDWFTADPRLHIDGEDHSELVAVVRRQVEVVTGILAQSSFSDIPIRGVLCFGSVQPGWVGEPFVIDGISVTWRRRLVEPFLDPVLVDLRSRTALVHALAGSVVRGTAAEVDGRVAADPSETVAG